jgi:hypothetical protein
MAAPALFPPKNTGSKKRKNFVKMVNLAAKQAHFRGLFCGPAETAEKKSSATT